MKAMNWKHLMLVDGKIATSKVTTFKSTIETMAIEMVWALNKCLQKKMVNLRQNQALEQTVALQFVEQ
jgi:hypothetical protein